MKADLRITAVSFLLVGIVAIFFSQTTILFIPPLAYIVYTFIVGTISAFRKK